MTSEQLERARAGMAKAREALARKREQQKQNMNTTTSVIKEPEQPQQPQPAPATGDQVFVLLKSGLGSNGMAKGNTYEEMWADATAKTGITKADLLKQGYMFDIVSPEVAQRMFG